MPENRDTSSGQQQDIDIRKLPRSQRAVVVAGPYALFAVGAGVLAYALAALQGAMGSTCVGFGAGLLVVSAVLPRARSFRISATGVSAEMDGTYVGPSVAPAASTFSAQELEGLREVGGVGEVALQRSLKTMTAGREGEHEAVADSAARLLRRPTLSEVVAVAKQQGWGVERGDGSVTLTAPVGQSLSYSEKNENDPISTGFLSSLIAYGLRWELE